MTTRIRRLRRTAPKLLASVTALALGAGLALNASAVSVPVDRTLNETPVRVASDTVELDWANIGSDQVEPMEGLVLNHDNSQEMAWDLDPHATHGSMRVSKGAHSADGRTSYDVLVDIRPEHPDASRQSVFILTQPTEKLSFSTFSFGNHTSQASGPTQSSRITISIVRPGTTTPIDMPASGGITTQTDLDGWAEGWDEEIADRYRDAEHHDEGIRLRSGWSRARIASQAHLTIDTPTGSTMSSENFTGKDDEDNYLGTMPGPDFSAHHNLQHMVQLRFRSPTLSLDYFSQRPRWSGYIIDTLPRTIIRQHAAVRTIVMHEPVNKTITQTATVSTDANGSWSTGTWPAYDPQTVDGWTASTRHVDKEQVTSQTKDETIEVWYSTTARFFARAASCSKQGRMKYGKWASMTDKAQTVRYGEGIDMPQAPKSLPSTWANGAWRDGKESSSKAVPETVAVTSAQPAFYWHADPPSGRYSLTVKSRSDGRILSTRTLGGPACSVSTPQPKIPTGWHKAKNQPDLPASVTIPIDGTNPQDLVVLVERDTLSRLPQTGSASDAFGDPSAKTRTIVLATASTTAALLLMLALARIKFVRAHRPRHGYRTGHQGYRGRHSRSRA